MLSRWLLYQQTRFSIVNNGLLMAAFSFSTLGYWVQVEGNGSERSVLQFLGLGMIGFINVYLFFLQVHLLDDLKDSKTDMLYRSQLPVSQNILSRTELKIGLIATGLMQLGLAFSAGLSVVLMLGALWGYLVLLSKDFFITEIHNKPLVNLLAYGAIVPFVMVYVSLFYGSKFDGIERLLGLLAVSFSAGILFQLGRKISSFHHETLAAQINSFVWSGQKPILIWLSVIWVMSVVTLIAAAQIQWIAAIAFNLLFLLTASTIVAWRFLTHFTPKWANGIQFISNLWIFLVYFNLGIVPLLFQPALQTMR
jgi:hypothetical protein